MGLKSSITLLGRAAAIATLTIGTMAAGLTLTTYTVAKANEMMFDQPVMPVGSVKSVRPDCV